LLNLYIDDRAILACGKEWANVESSLTAAYNSCTLWLDRSGLKVEPDKMELIYFRQRHEKVDLPGEISLRRHPQHIHYKITAVHQLRYLGFFLDHKLRWEHHINIMCNHTWAFIKALQLLGNSV